MAHAKTCRRTIFPAILLPVFFLVLFPVLEAQTGYAQILANSDLEKTLVVAPVYTERETTNSRFISQLNESLVLHQTAYALLRHGVSAESCTPVRKIPILFGSVSMDRARQFGLPFSHAYIAVGALDSQPELQKLQRSDALVAVDGVDIIRHPEKLNDLMASLQTGPPTVKLSFEGPAGRKFDLNVDLITLPCDFRFILYPEMPELQAFTDGRNTVVVSSALVRFVENKEQLSFVLGHEMAHIHLGHLRGKKMRAIFHKVIAGTASAFTETKLNAQDPNSAELAAAAGELAGGLVTAPFSKEAEREADRLSLEYLRAADFDPVKAAAFLKKMAVSLQAAEAFNFTHPAPSSRYEELMEQMGLQPEPLDSPGYTKNNLAADPQKREAAHERRALLAERKKQWAQKPGTIYIDKDFIEISAEEYASQLHRYSNWKRLAQNLAPQDVISLLGEPDNKGASPNSTWTYPDGTVEFNGLGLLAHWEFPPAPRKIINPGGTEEKEPLKKKMPGPVDPLRLFPEDMAGDTVVGSTELKNGKVVPLTKTEFESHMREARETAQKVQEEKAARREFIAKNTHVEYIVGEGKAGDVRNWRRLKKGMSGSGTEDLLGEPLSEGESSDGIFTYKVWNYGTGKVFFYKRKVSRWEAPAAKRVTLLETGADHEA